MEDGEDQWCSIKPLVHQYLYKVVARNARRRHGMYKGAEVLTRPSQPSLAMPRQVMAAYQHFNFLVRLRHH
jgi:hypothetical protein